MTLTDRVPTIDGDVIVITKTRFLFLFSRPRTSVMPHGFSDFGRRLGFQAVYRTRDPAILKQFHDYFVQLVLAGGFEAQLIASKLGVIEFPQGYEHLKGYIIGFHA